MKYITILFIILSLSLAEADAQIYTFENVDKPDYNSSGKIIDGENILGYYLFYKKEKIDRKGAIFNFTVLDNNLNKATDFDIETVKNGSIQKMAYNHQSFLLDIEDIYGIYYPIYDIYNPEGKKTGTIGYDCIPIKQGRPISENPIWPLGEYGYVFNFYYPDKLQFRFDAFDNQAKRIWEFTQQHPDAPKGGEAVIFSVDTNYTIAVQTKPMHSILKSFSDWLIILNSKNGQIIIDTAFYEGKTAYSISDAIVDYSDTTFIIHGEYFKSAMQMASSQSLGLYFMKLDKNGHQILLKQYSWSADLLKLKTTEELKDEKLQIHIYDIVRTGNNELFAIAEKYLSHNLEANNWTISKEFLILKFDNQFTLTDVQSYPHNGIKKEVTAVLNNALSKRQIQIYHTLDLNSIDKKPNSPNFKIVYADNIVEKDKMKKAAVNIGIINFEAGKFTQSSSTMESDGDNIWFEKGKDGYISVLEYYKATKKLKMHFEKLEY